MSQEVLIAGKMPQYTLDKLVATFPCHKIWEAGDRDALIDRLAPSLRAIATTGHDGASAAMIARLPKLEIISCFGVGVDAIDLDAARKAGVIVTNTPDVLNDDVADLAVGLALAVTRAIPQGDRYVREGRWKAEGMMALQTRFSGMTVGILGLGRIGKVIARRCAAFDCTVLYHGRHAQDDVPYRFYADLTAMARDADMLIAICPGGEATRHIVNRPVLEALGPKGFFVNVARGSVVNEDDLIAVLQAGGIAGAGLDVFAAEPDVRPELLTFPNVVVQPHVASATHATRAAMGDLTVENIALHFAGKPVRTPVG
ncbi:MAG: 2-hydroxyacid dehydrogenase [Alphaproteobacteria bacterium]